MTFTQGSKLRFARRLYLLALLLAAGGCGKDPLSPTGADSVTAPTVPVVLGRPSALGTAVVTGRVAHALNESSLAGVVVEIPGVGVTTTQADGTFSLTASGPLPLPVVVTGDGFHRRETHVSVTSGRDVVLDLLPHGGGFDLSFFDHVFRELGRSGTERWDQEPQFEIWSKVYDCVPGERTECDVLEATEQDAPGQFLQLSRDTIQVDAPKYTGGFVRGSNIVTASHAAGTRLELRDYLRAGKITFILIRKRDDVSWARVWPYASGAMYSGSVQITKASKASPGVYSHELAHTMGFYHPLAHRDVPLPSIMRDAVRMTQHDVLHGRILYQRPPGSRTADRDPENFSINALRADVGGEPDWEQLRRIAR